MIRTIAITLALLAMLPAGTAALAQSQPPTPATKTQPAPVAATPAAPPAAQPQPNAAPAAPLWLMTCSNQLQPDHLQCEFSQSIVLTRGNQRERVATASFSRVAGQPQTQAAFTLPYGVSLPDPVKIMVDDKEVGSLAWQSCDAGGCYASGTVDGAWLQAMRNGNKLTTALKARDGRALNFVFQLDGFTKAEAMLP